MTINSRKHKILRSSFFNSKDKVSIFLNKRKDLDKISSILKKVCEKTSGNFRLTSFDVDLPAYFQDLNIDTDYSWNYLNDSDCASADSFFFKNFARNWLLSQNSRQDHIQGYFDEYKMSLLSKAIEFDFIQSNFVLIKYTEVIRKVFINYGPTKIIIIEDSPILSNIVKAFSEKYTFKYIRINPKSNPILDRVKALRKTVKTFLTDLAILLIDFFVLCYISISKSLENKIVIDYRLYKKFSNTKLKKQLLICPFEKGLNIRLQMLSLGIFYLPVIYPSCFNLFQGRQGFKLRKIWNAMKTGPESKNRFKYKDIMFWDGIERYLRKTFLMSFPRILANAAAFQRFAQKKNIKLVVMRNDMKELERTIIEASRRLKIPSLVIQHGIAGNLNLSNTLCAGMTAVWGRADIDWFKQFGYSAERFAITGNPFYDELYSRASGKCRDIAREQVCRKLHLAPKKRIVTFLTQYVFLFSTCFTRGSKSSAALRAVLEALQSFSDIQLIIKVHPYDEDLRAYNTIIQRSNPLINVAMVKEFNTFDILEASDLVIAVEGSSSGLEALILDKPLVALDLNKNVTKVPYAEERVAIGVKNVADIKSAIKNALYDEKTREALRLNRKRFIFDYAYKIDGQAGKRVEELIYKLANNI